MKTLLHPFSLTLKQKLIGGINLALASLVVVSLIAVFGSNQIVDDGRRLYKEGFQQVVLVGRFQTRFEQLDALVSRAPIELNLAQLERQRAEFRAILAEIKTGLIDFQGETHDAADHHRGHISEMFSALDHFAAEGEKVYEFASTFQQEQALEVLNTGSREAREHLKGVIDMFTEDAGVQARGLVNAMEAEATDLKWWAALSSVLLILTVGTWSFVTVLGACRDLGKISGVTVHLAAGNMEITVPGGNRADEIGEMARSLEHIRVVGVKAARAQSSLDDASSPMMIVDLDGTVLFPNKAMVTLADRLAEILSSELPGFAQPELVGVKFDTLHNVETMHSDCLKAEKQQTKARMVAVRRTIDMTASPVFNDEGERLGTVVEWQDMTAQVTVEQEIAGIVHAASIGDFSQRLTEADKSGFMADLANGMNELLDVVDNGLSQVVDVMAALAEGDLTRRMKGQYSGAFERLKLDADRMGQQMEEMVGRIAGMSSIVKSATNEISAGIADLSSRTEHQASSLEETTASMEELSATVRQNAENANVASDVAATAKNVAEKGSEVVDRVVNAMGDIEQSSHRVTDIVGLIQEIAFQTNLLALNASVEAARAGSAGRGFAVVANEVRALAQRSAAASKDIKELITSSDGQVQEGVRLVGEAGDALEEIVTSVKKVAELVSEIAGASREQTAGLDQVSSAVNSMDEMTQKNAALVEETTSAIMSAVTQVDDLQTAVGFFKTKRSSVPAETEPSDDMTAVA
jgi:methyl-accepting chemotaxis protein